MKRPQVHLRFDPKLHAQIAKVAKVRGTTAADVVRDAVAVALGVCPTCGSEHKDEQDKPARRSRQAAA